MNQYGAAADAVGIARVEPLGQPQGLREVEPDEGDARRELADVGVVRARRRGVARGVPGVVEVGGAVARLRAVEPLGGQRRGASATGRRSTGRTRRRAADEGDEDRRGTAHRGSSGVGLGGSGLDAQDAVGPQLSPAASGELIPHNARRVEVGADLEQHHRRCGSGARRAAR